MSCKKSILSLLFLVLISLPSFAQTGNVKQGNGAGKSITTGNYNIMVGDSAAFRLTSGRFGVFLGRRSGYNATSSSENVFIGADAGYSNTIGTDNVFIGYEAGMSVSNSSDNVFIGTKAGRVTTTGDDNVFIGEEAGLNNTTGDKNVFIGEDAGYNNTTGYDNTFIGRTAGKTNTTGYKNTAIGHESGYDLSEGFEASPSSVLSSNYGSYNTFVGDSTGVDVGKGAYNTFVGQAAGATTELGSRNTFVGFRAGWENNRTNNDNQGNENTYLGFRTGHKNRQGNYNVLIGSRTDFRVATSSKNSYNVVIGYNSEIDAINNSILIGKSSRVREDNSIAIGNDIDATLANTLILGGATNRVTVGIGTDAPNRKSSLDLSDTDKGFLVNRLTTAEKTTLASSLTATDLGMLIYDVNVKQFFSWDGTAWVSLSASSSSSGLETRITALENRANASANDRTPLLFNYQTALLGADDNALASTTVSFRISILQTTNTGTRVYTETHSATTDARGITNFKIGNGTVVSGDFSAINWGSDIYFLKVEADVTGGTSYQDFGTSQFVTVPYAMHARTADRLVDNTSSRSSTTKTAVNPTVNDNEIETLKKEIASLKEVVNQLKQSLKNNN